jgi:hypothetical protein
MSNLMREMDVIFPLYLPKPSSFWRFVRTINPALQWQTV